jgi:hypothetical protein
LRYWQLQTSIPLWRHFYPTVWHKRIQSTLKNPLTDFFPPEHQ